MNAPLDNIVQHLFHQPSLQSVTVDELERVAQQNPSFAVAQFLLLKKMQETEHPGFTQQLHKTTLYFNNPLWLQFLLQSKHESQPIYGTSPTEETARNNGVDKDIAEEKKWDHSIKEINVPEPLHHIVEAENEIELIDPSTVVAIDVQTGPLSAMEIAEQFDFKNGSEQKEAVETPAPTSELNAAHELLAENSTVQTDPVLNEVNEHKALETTEEQPAEFITEIPAETSADATVVTPAVSSSDNQGTMEADDTEVQHSQPAADEASHAPLLKTVIETPAAKDDLLFEPYHTIDYFASQGIKLSKIEPEPKDKLGRQLKSFTEWLKMMKKLPPVSVDKILAENEESQVVESANHSIESKEVITEAMAEVFEKQGLHEKAAEVYNKLSLLNPAKSAYFAGRIEDLKR